MNNQVKPKAARYDLVHKVKRALFPQGIIWPGRKECWNKTGTVILTCVAFGAILIGTDVILGVIFGLLLG